VTRKYYTGIGARATPTKIRAYMIRIARHLESRGYTLRSGGAYGADSAFEFGVTNHINKHIYLPWEGFNGNQSPFFEPQDWAYKLAEKYHPNWYSLKRGVKALMARNMHQIVGLANKTHSKAVICWTRDGLDSGGTGQALRFARDLGIPIFNLHDKKVLIKMLNKYGIDLRNRRKL